MIELNANGQMLTPNIARHMFNMLKPQRAHCIRLDLEQRDIWKSSTMGGVPISATKDATPNTLLFENDAGVVIGYVANLAGKEDR